MGVGNLLFLLLAPVLFVLFWYGLYLIATKKNPKELQSSLEKIAVITFMSLFWWGGIISFLFKLSSLTGFPFPPELLKEVKEPFLYRRIITQGYGYIDLVALFLFSAFFTVAEIKLWKTLGWRVSAVGILIALIGWLTSLFLG